METYITYRTASQLPDTVEGEPEDMPLTTLAEYVTLLADSDASRALIRGNEPLLHPEFQDFTARLAEHNIPPVIETTGLAGTDALGGLSGRDFEMILKLYHPDAYPADNIGTAIRTGREVPEPARRKLHLSLVIDDPTRDYGFVRELLPELRPVSVKIKLACPLPREKAKLLSKWMVKELPDMARQGLGVQLDCALRPCAFSDAGWGRLAKMGINPDRCVPHPGVRPDGRIYHCTRMINDPAGQLADFDTRSQVVGYLYERYGNWQNRVDITPGCRECDMLRAGSCVGECLVLKGRAMQRQIDEYEEQEFSDMTVEDIARLAGLYLAMQRADKAERWLVAARQRYPEAGPVHLMLARVLRARDRTAEAREEYKKASRLIPGEPRIRAEMEQMLSELGKKNTG